MGHPAGFNLLDLKEAAEAELRCDYDGMMFTTGELRGPPVPRLAPPLLYAEVRGVRVPKQTSAEATNGKLVSS
jgi:hypothetical protein